MEKNGTILMWDEDSEYGEIEDLDGNLYEFGLDNCSGFSPEEGLEVSFIVEDEEIDSVYLA